MTTLEHMSSHMCWAELPLLSLSLQYCQYWNVGHIEGGREGGREPSLHWVVTNLSLCIKWKYFWSTVKPLSQTTVTKKLRVLCGFLELRLRQSRLISSSLHLLLRSFLLMDWSDWTGVASPGRFHGQRWQVGQWRAVCYLSAKWWWIIK